MPPPTRAPRTGGCCSPDRHTLRPSTQLLGQTPCGRGSLGRDSFGTAGPCQFLDGPVGQKIVDLGLGRGVGVGVTCRSGGCFGIDLVSKFSLGVTTSLSVSVDFCEVGFVIIDATARLRGWCAELADAGLRSGPQITGDWTAASGRRTGEQLIQAKRMPTAVFVANDPMALGFIRAMHDAGINVPGDISVVGFDDMPGADNFLPSLKTARQDWDRLGHQCIDMLIAASHKTPNDWPLVPPVLVIARARRGSRKSALGPDGG